MNIPDRITIDDFRTPPEFRTLRLAPSSSGQIGGARLELLAGEGGTRLGACYQQIPLRVLPPFRFADEPAALLYLLNPTAGLMDSDAHLLHIHARAGVRAVVTGQSATRIHPALRSFATQQWQICVEDDARLVVLPGPAIPFAGCRYYQRVRIDLAARAQLVWGDIWLPGRYARGPLSELYRFERLIQDLEVRREGELIYRERFGWRGPWDEETIRWHLGDRSASGSLFATGPMRELPQSGEEVNRAIFSLRCGDTSIRCCGSPSAVLRDVVHTALMLAACEESTSPHRPWLLAAHHLAPNHWFSPPYD